MAYLVQQTEIFAAWLEGLRDLRARIAVARRVERVDVGPGYRLYFTRRRGVVVILLCGGDKRSQKADIARAQRLATEQ